MSNQTIQEWDTISELLDLTEGETHNLQDLRLDMELATVEHLRSTLKNAAVF